MTLNVWWEGLSARERRIIASALAVVGLALLLTRALPAWQSWVDSTGNRRGVLVDSLAQMRALASSGSPDGASLPKTLLEMELASTSVLTGRSEELVLSRLLGLLTAAADDVGVTLSTAQGLPLVSRGARSGRRAPGQYSTVSVRATGTGDAELLPELLAFIDTSRTQLSTRSFSVSPATISGEGRTHSVQFDLVVSALVRIDAASPTRPQR